MVQDPTSYSINFGNTATWVAFLLGLIVYVIGFFGGLRMNLARAIAAIVLATGVNVVGHPLVNRAHTFIASILGAQVAGFVVPVGWTIFVLGVGLSLYESFTVTAREAHPMK